MLKSVFSQKYGLILRSLDIDIFELDSNFYILDIKEMKLEQYSNKFSQLSTERKLINFCEKYQYKNLKLRGEAQNIKEVQSLFFSMYGSYEKVRNTILYDYLNLPEKDQTSNKVFESLKPECPYDFTELMSDSINKKEFKKWASNNLWKN